MDSPREPPSGIPRLSRLPVPRPTSSIPKPSAPIRPKPSRDSLSGIGRDLNPQKLHGVPSREQLRSTVSNSSLRGVASRDQLRTSIHQTKRTEPVPKSFGASSSHGRDSSVTTQSQNADENEHNVADHDQSDQSPEQVRPPFSVGSLPSNNGIELGADGSDAVLARTPSVRKVRPRPSLSERTMETLANIPPSPALKKKTSSFFDQGRPRSRAENGTSRPGSSHRSEAFGRAPSRQANSRPGSSAGLDDSSIPGFRGSSSPFKSTLSTINGTPRRSSGIGVSKTPQPKATPCRGVLSSLKQPSSGIPHLTDAVRSPSPIKKAFGAVSVKSSTKPTGLRPVKTRTSINGLAKQQPQQSISRTANTTEEPEAPATAWDGATLPPPSTPGRPVNAKPAPFSNRKSSAALREQIAKAKAAKRAAVRQASATQEPVIGGDTSVLPSGDDFGVDYDDPFNLRKGETAGEKVLQQRVSSARTSGRLNIAALGLKQMPPEVMKMYNLETIGGVNGSWAESVDLTRLVAADNEIESLDDVFPDTNPDAFNDQDEGQGNIFGGLETLDLHGNLLASVPRGFRHLTHLTSLNLSSNKLENSSLDIVSQMTSLRDLKLSKNQLYGPLNSALMSLGSLEMLDMHGNCITALPAEIENLTRLRILNLNENKLETLPFDNLSKLPLTELSARKNRLSGVLISQTVDSLPCLQTLDVSANQLTHLVPADTILSLPVAHAVSVSVNRLQCLPDMSAWPNLLTLAVDENHIPSIPESFTSLQKLRHADFASNDIRAVPPEIARMQSLSMIRLTGNPLRDRKLVSAATDELKEILAGRLEPPPPYQEPGNQSTITGLMSNFAEMDGKLQHVPLSNAYDEDAKSDVEDDFTTPPTSAPHTPTRSRSATVVKDTWFVKAGGLLDLSGSGMSSVNPTTCCSVASRNQVRQVQLHHNPLTSIPLALSAFASSLSFLSLAHCQLAGDSYLSERLELPALRELSLLSNQITSLEPMKRRLIAPSLEKLDITHNRMNTLPIGLMQAFPQLSVLLMASNQLTELDPDCIQGLKIVDASSNDIGQLNPRLGLLGGVDGLHKLEVSGNRFKVPRWSILEQGTEATLRWLRGRLPAEEMQAWRQVNGEESGDDTH